MAEDAPSAAARPSTPTQPFPSAAPLGPTQVDVAQRSRGCSAGLPVARGGGSPRQGCGFAFGANSPSRAAERPPPRIHSARPFSEVLSIPHWDHGWKLLTWLLAFGLTRFLIALPISKKISSKKFMTFLEVM